MSRFLIVVPPFPSHVYPTVAIGQTLAQRGHAVAWVTYEAMRSTLPADATVYTLASPISAQAAQELQRQAGATWLAGMKVLFEQVLVPLARDMLPGVETAITDFEPDALLVDQQALAGALAARRRGLPWATSSTSSALLGEHFGPYPKVEDWIVGLFAGLQREMGLEPVRWPDRSPELVLLYTVEQFVGGAHPPHYLFIGPALAKRAEPVDFPWDALRPGPRVFVSLGSVWAWRGERFYRIVASALADLPVQVIVAAPPGMIVDVPKNFIVRPWVPLLELYPHLDAVVTHAGTTVNEALAHGIPVVVAPMVHDQSIFAQHAVAAGAGLRVAFNRVTAARMREVVMAVLEVPSYRDAARRVELLFRSAGGAAAAVPALERLAGRVPAA